MARRAIAEAAVSALRRSRSASTDSQRPTLGGKTVITPGAAVDDLFAVGLDQFLSLQTVERGVERARREEPYPFIGESAGTSAMMMP